mmetsp:Transcript_18599/g.26178  ORF Transcript_18599/g.26178 Transcript_18599/m.26178 type:complete len:90 (-) Transcript_18599:955-1224(-)
MVHTALVLAQVIFGGGSVVGKLGIDKFNPISFAFIREGSAGPILCIFAYLKDRVLPNPRHIWWFFFGPDFSSSQTNYISSLELSYQMQW